MKSISVIVPAHNYARYLREAIDSALGQICAPLEVIVVDDGSTDETPQVLAEYGDRIRVIRQVNQGAAAARNTGVAAARGEYVAFLDSDDVWRPRKLERQMACFDEDPALGMVHCGAETMAADGRTLGFLLDGLAGWVGTEMLRLDREVVLVPGSSLLLPKRVVEEVGGFDVRLSPSEDWDLAYRVAARYPVGFVAEPLVRYRLHGGGIHLNIGKMERSMFIALDRAFASAPALRGLRRHTYGRMHRILAGCYFQAREPREFVRHMVKSLRYDPRNIAHFGSYPWRAISRWRKSTPSAAPR